MPSALPLTCTGPQTFPSCPLSTVETCSMYSVRMACAQKISPQGDKGTYQLPNKPEEHPLEKKPEKSYACLLSLFFSWDPSPQKGDLTHHRAGLQKTCQLPHAAPTPPTSLHHIHPTVPTCHPGQEQPTSYQLVGQLLSSTVTSASGWSASCSRYCLEDS